jgi:hypothetical protein
MFEVYFLSKFLKLQFITLGFYCMKGFVYHLFKCGLCPECLSESTHIHFNHVYHVSSILMWVELTIRFATVSLKDIIFSAY